MINPNQPSEPQAEQPVEPQPEYQGEDSHGLPPSKCKWENGDSLTKFTERVAREFVESLNKAALRGEPKP